MRCLAAASFGAIANGRQLVTELRDVRREWAGRVTARRDSAVWRVVDLLFQHPVVNAPLVARELSMAQPNTYRHIEALARADILVESTDQKRNRAWRAPDVLEALDAFASRAGRRASP